MPPLPALKNSFAAHLSGVTPSSIRVTIGNLGIPKCLEYISDRYKTRPVKGQGGLEKARSKIEKVFTQADLYL